MPYTKQNDTYDKVYYRATTRSGEVIDLTGASVQFKMESEKGQLLVNSPATILNAVNGEMIYDLSSGDTILSGKHIAEFTVTFSDGSEKTFPEDGYIEVLVTSDIDTNRDTEAINAVAYSTNVIHFKGVVATFADLPTTPELGDTYQVENDATATNNGTWRWDDTEWVRINSPQAYDTRLINAESSIASHETSISDHETRITTNETNIADHETRVTDVESNLSLQDQQTKTLQHGLNLIESDTDVASPLKVEFYGMSRTNHMGREGGFHKQGKWDANLVIDTSTYKFGTSSGKIDNSAGTASKSSYNQQKMYLQGKYVLIGVWARAVSGTPQIDVTLNEYDSSDTFLSSNPFINNQSIDSTWKFYYAKADLTAKTGAYFKSILATVTYGTADDVVNFDGLVVYPLTSTQYNEIGVSWTDSDVERMFPYVDSIKGVKHPVIRVESGQLFNIHDVNLHANAELTDPRTITLNATGGYQQSDVLLDCVPNTQYTIKINNGGSANAYWRVRENSSSGAVITTQNTTTSFTFTTGASVSKLFIALYNDVAGTFTFSDIMLNLGSTSLPYTDYNSDYLYAETTLYGNDVEKDILFEKENQFYHRKNWEAGVLDGSLNYTYYNSTTGAKSVRTDVNVLKDGISGTEKVEKDDGSILETVSSFYGTTDYNSDECFLSTNGQIYITISDTDATGYDLTTTAGIQAYFTDKNYFLLYELAEPVTVPVTVEGSLSISGDAQVTVGELVQVNETATPVLNAQNQYVINSTYTGEEISKLDYRLDRVLRVLEDEQEFENYRLVTSTTAYGNYKIVIDNPNTNATYKVTYVAINDGQSAHLNNIKAEFHRSMKSSFQSVVEKQSDIATEVSIHDRQILDIMLRLDAGGL